MRRWWLIPVVVAGVFAVAPAPVLAAPDPPPGAVPSAPAAPARAGCGDPTPDAVRAYFAGTLPDRLTQDRIPGATVSVVSGGRTVFAQGYGVADREYQVPFDADRSMVRIASITKLFTATAVMQQVQAGRLDLNADVNRYLTKFKIPGTYPAPVTVGMLLNHTAGFEDRVIGTGALAAADVPPLGEYLAAHMPARIRPPGEISAYSNYGAALAGYLVSQVSGEPYDRYVQRHILDPLGMTHSTASEPVPAALAGDLARSYNSDSDPPRRVPFEFDRMAPDGSISASATDLAKFMIAHLDGTPILDPAVAALMHAQSFTADPRVAGYAYGFKERYLAGHRLIMHDGGWEGFVSVLMLVPDCDLGLFLSINGTGAEHSLDLIYGFLDRFASGGTASGGTASGGTASGGTASGAPATGAAKPAGADRPRTGFYKPTRRSETTMEKLLVLLGPMRLSASDGDHLHFKGTDWTRQGDGSYRRADGTDHLVFVTRGGRRYVVTDSSAYEAMPQHETLPVNLGVLLAFIVTALSALAVPVAASWRLARRRRDPDRPRIAGRWRLARWLTTAAGLGGLAFLTLLLLTLLGDAGDFLYGAPPRFLALLAVPPVVLAAAAGGAAWTVLGWRGAGVRTAARVHQVVLLAGLVPLGWFLWQWNLIGWQLG